VKRPELFLGGALLFAAAFIVVEARRGPRRAAAPSATTVDTAPAGGLEGLGLSHVKPSTLPPPPPRDYADIRARIAAAKGVTYMDDILAERGNNVARWVDRRENPITVWIQPRPLLRDFWPEFRDRVRDAFYTWAASGVPIKFLFIDDSTAAEVRVRWVDRFNDAAAGKTYWARDQNWWIVDADIDVAIHRSSGEAYDQQMVRTIALHEVGHLIGLDHSSNPDDIMSARVHVMGLSAADLRTAALIYKLPPGSIVPPRAP
jgi:hypothetical protein